MDVVGKLATGALAILFAGATLNSTPETVLAKEARPASIKQQKTGAIEGVFCSKMRLKTRGPTSERDVVLYLRSKDPKKHAAPKDPILVQQKKLQFMPHVVPLLAGSSIRFENEDKVDHNVFASEDCCKIDATAGPGKGVTQTFPTPGTASIVCRLHPDMSLWVVILEEPWFTSTSLKKEKTPAGERQYVGQYSIGDVPPGEYELTFWSKTLKPETYPVTIVAGETAKLDVTITDD